MQGTTLRGLDDGPTPATPGDTSPGRSNSAHTCRQVHHRAADYKYLHFEYR